MLLPQLLHVVFVLGKGCPVLERTCLTHEDPVLHDKIGCFVFQTVDAELVELVLKYFLVKISN